MRFRLRGGPGHGRVYDFPTPLPAAMAILLDNNRRAVYTLSDWPRGQDVAAIYTHERTE